MPTSKLNRGSRKGAEAQHQAQQQAPTSEADAGSGELRGHAYPAPATFVVQRHRQHRLHAGGGAAQQTQQPQGQQGADGYTDSHADPSAQAGSAEYWQQWLASPDSAACWRHYGETTSGSCRSLGLAAWSVRGNCSRCEYQEEWSWKPCCMSWRFCSLKDCLRHL